MARAIVPRTEGRGVLGSVTLRAHQRELAERAHAALRAHGGALVADDVGSGKTFVALELAARHANPLVIAPAALRDTWSGAGRRAGVPHTFLSVELLSRGEPVPDGHDLVIVDEAHHLRNPRTARHRAVRVLARRARLLLLTGTPVHNSAGDLDALLSLFLGAGARDFTSEARADVVIRSAEAGRLPEVVVHRPHAIGDADDVVACIVGLPPIVAPRDGTPAPALFRCALLRAWCSSAAALDAMARGAYLRASALADALESGVEPTRRELAAWSGEQRGLFFDGAPPAGASHARVAECIAALAHLRAAAQAHRTADDERAAVLLRLADSNPGIPILACTQYAATVDTLWRRLRTTSGVAALTSRGARIASGTVCRTDALAMFAPAAQGRRLPHERERIRLLITTDLASEGLNLQDAGIAVHIDLPWTAARLAQRVGRIARAGSPHARVHVHALAPPRAAAALLALERRIARKRRIGEQAAGGGDRNAALLGVARRGVQSPAEARAQIIRLLAPFAGSSESSLGTEPPSAAVVAPHNGWLALVIGDGGRARLVMRAGRAAARSDPRAVADAVAWLCTGDACPPPRRWRRAVSEIERWMRGEQARALAGAGRPHAAREQVRALAAHMGRIRGAAPHARARAAHLAGSGSPPTEDEPGRASLRLAAIAIFVRDAENRSPL